MGKATRIYNLVHWSLCLREINGCHSSRTASSPSEPCRVSSGWRQCTIWAEQGLGVLRERPKREYPKNAEVAKLFADSSTIALTSFISPYIADRKIARDLHTSASQGGDDAIPFIEVFVDIPVEVAEKRDPKGLYKKARAGEIPNFTGISAPYEKPENPEIHIKTDELSIEECVVRIVEYLQAQKLLP